MSRNGFWKENLRTSYECDLDWKKFWDVIQIQPTTTLVIYVLLKPVLAQKYCHSAIAEIGNKAVWAAEISIEESMDRNVLLKIKEKDELQLSIGCIQLFFDKSPVLFESRHTGDLPSLCSSSRPFRRIAKASHYLVRSCKCMRPSRVSQSWKRLEWLVQWYHIKKSKICINARSRQLKSFHESMKSCSQPLANCAFQWLECKTYYGKKVLFHFLMTSYIAVFLGYDDILAVKRGINMSAPCHIMWFRLIVMRKKTIIEKLLNFIRAISTTMENGSIQSFNVFNSTQAAYISSCRCSFLCRHTGDFQIWTIAFSLIGDLKSFQRMFHQIFISWIPSSHKIGVEVRNFLVFSNYLQRNLDIIESAFVWF